MKTGADATVMFDDLKNGLSAPIAGMSVSFTSSLFGLAGSLILGFLDLQAGQAQNRFYTELEDFLASHVETTPAPIVEASARESRRRRRASISATAPPPSPISQRAFRASSPTCAQEQQLIRDWVEAQASQQEEVRKLLQRLAREHETR